MVNIPLEDPYQQPLNLNHNQLSKNSIKGPTFRTSPSFAHRKPEGKITYENNEDLCCTFLLVLRFGVYLG